MSNQRLSGSLALTKLIHVKMTKKGKDGQEVLGLFIPIDANMLVTGAEKDGVTPIYMPVNVHIKAETDDKGQNGFIAKTIDSKTYKALTDEQKEDSKRLSPILGSVKDWGASSAEDNSGDQNSGATVDEHDDLPF